MINFNLFRRLDVVLLLLLLFFSVVNVVLKIRLVGAANTVNYEAHQGTTTTSNKKIAHKVYEVYLL